MIAEPILITKLVVHGNFYYAKCLSCSAKVFKVDDKFKCKKGHVHTRKSWEFYFTIHSISLKSLKSLYKTIFGNLLEGILGFTASQVLQVDTCNEKTLSEIINALSNLLEGQMAVIKYKSNIINSFKLASSQCNLLDFLQKHEIRPSNPQDDILLSFKEKSFSTNSDHHQSLMTYMEEINWKDWFSLDQDLHDEFSNPMIDEIVCQISDLIL